jgi:cell division protein FtsW
MGEQAFVTRLLPHRPRRGHRRITLDVDVPLLLTMITLILYGLVMVYSASWDFSYYLYEGSSSHIIMRQIMWVFFGTIIAVALTFVKYHAWQKLALPLMGVTVLALAGVLLIGELRLGATRAFLSGSIQPSELAKLATVIYLAVWLNAKRDMLDSWGFGLLPLATILGLVGALIYLQPDLSAVFTVIALGGMLFFLAGGDLRRIATLVFSSILIGFLFVQFSPTGKARVDNFIVGLQNPTEADYHVKRSLQAFAEGGIFGKGIGKAETKLTGLPVPPTDSIFAVVGEETGIVGSAFLVGLFVMLLWRTMVIARRAPDRFGSLLAAGLGFWIVMEAMINMLVIVGLLPFAGNALPFVSAGGSNMLVSLAAIGILMNISRSSLHEQEKREPFFNALVNLRRGDRRRRVSRPRRPSSPSAT